MSYTMGVRGDAIQTLGQIPIPTGSVSSIISDVTGLFADRAEQQRISDINSAYARGDAAYLIAWINDNPPHPTASVQYAQQKLAALQHGTGGPIPTPGGGSIMPGSAASMLGGGGVSPMVLLLGAGLLFFALSRR